MTFEEYLKFRDIYMKHTTEWSKIGSEFSKLVLSGLLYINAGALATIPFLIGLSDHGKKLVYFRDVFQGPGVLFILGLLFSLLAMFFTYLNFGKISLATQYEFLFFAADSENNFEKSHQSALTDARNYYWAAFTAAWGSFFLFIVGSVFMYAKLTAFGP